MWTETLRDIVGTIGSVITAGTAVAAVLIAKRGLETWRRQMHGQSDHALARRILLAVYNVRQAIRAARSPIVMGGELAAAAKRAGIEKFDHLDSAQSKLATEGAYWARFQTCADAWNKLQVEQLEAEAVWGLKHLSGVLELRTKIVDLEVALMEYLDDRQTSGPDYADRMKALRAVIFNIGSIEQPDEYMAAVDAAIAEMESTVRPYLGVAPVSARPVRAGS